MSSLISTESSNGITPADSTSDGVPGQSFDFGTRLGIVLIIEAAFVSLVAVLSLLVYIAYSASALTRDARRRWNLATPLHWYFLSMMFSELIQSTGGILDLRWVIQAGVSDGAYCTAQGVLKSIGDVSVALSTLLIAVHTFRAVVMRRTPEQPLLTATIVLFCMWTAIALIMGISAATHKHKEYWGDTQYWCWITSGYPVQQILLDYIFMWVAAFTNIILYIPLALVIKKVIVVNGFQVRWADKQDRMGTETSVTQASRGIDTIARQMLFYPLIYTITVLPIAICRFSAFHNKNVPFYATVLSDVLFSLSGLFNVILFSWTRPSLLPQRDSMYIEPQSMSFSMRSRMTETDHVFIGSRNSHLRISTSNARPHSFDAISERDWPPSAHPIFEGKEERVSPSSASIHTAVRDY